MLRRLLIPVLLLCVAAVSSIAVPPPRLGATLDGLITAARKSPGFRSAHVGVVVQSLADHSYWYAKATDHRFIPASTTKLVTAAMALEFLPIDFRFTTRLHATSQVVGDVLPGNLILRGGGDPTLVVEDLQALAHALAGGDPARGIPPVKSITGRVLLDDSAFPARGPQLGPNWEKGDLPWYYAAPATALSCNRNALTISVTGSTHGARPDIALLPNTQLFTIENKVMTSTSVKSGAISVSAHGYRVVITGTVAPGVQLTEKISIPDPAQLVAEQFRNALAVEGISVLGQAVDTQATAIVLAEHTSAPLPDVLRQMLKDSDNHTAEQLRWTMLANVRLSTPLRQRYALIQRDFAKRAGVKRGVLELVDGSGLSRSNKLRPRDVIRILAFLHDAPHFQALYGALPIAGVDGTLQRRMLGTPAVANAHAKTGTMRSVSGLTGYVTTKAGEELAFAIFINGYSSGATTARGLQDKIVSYLASLE